MVRVRTQNRYAADCGGNYENHAGRIIEAILSDQEHLLPKLHCQPIQSVEILCLPSHRIKYPPNKSSWASIGSSIGLLSGRREAIANGAIGVFDYELAQLCTA
jgi:hypothetical protein